MENINFIEKVGFQLNLGQNGVLKRLIGGGHAYLHLHGSFTLIQEQRIKSKLVAIKKEEVDDRNAANKELSRLPGQK